MFGRLGRQCRTTEEDSETTSSTATDDRNRTPVVFMSAAAAAAAVLGVHGRQVMRSKRVRVIYIAQKVYQLLEPDIVAERAGVSIIIHT